MNAQKHWKEAIMRCVQVLDFTWLISAYLMAGIGCSSTHSSDSASVTAAHCNGESITMIMSRDQSIWGDDLHYHSTGYLKSKQEDAWLMHWSLIERPTAPEVIYLGSYDEVRNVGGSEVLRTDGIPSSSLWPIGLTTSCLIQYRNIGIVKDGNVIGTVASSIQLWKGPGESPRKPIIWTKDRRHVFVWQPEPTIYSLPDLAVVKKCEPTVAFNEFESLYRWRGNVTELVTDDLSYLIAVPHNGASDSTQGGMHTKAFCYHVDRDEVSTIDLKGLGDAWIIDAKLVADKLHWLVQMRDPYRWVILDSESQQLATIPLPAPRPGCVYWDAEANVIWAVYFPRLLPNAKTTPEGVSVHKISTKDGSQVEFTLPTAKLTTRVADQGQAL